MEEGGVMSSKLEKNHQKALKNECSMRIASFVKQLPTSFHDFGKELSVSGHLTCF